MLELLLIQIAGKILDKHGVIAGRHIMPVSA